MPDSALRRATLEIESHVAQDGWDQPPRLYALVPTGDLLEEEPAIAEQLGIDADAAGGTYTPIEQEQLPADQSVEEALESIGWPERVAGCAAVLERLMLPPEAEENLPDQPEEVADYAANHPDRREVRMAVAVLRDGQRHCVIRVLTGAGTDGEVLEGPDLVPGLAGMLTQTLAD